MLKELCALATGLQRASWLPNAPRASSCFASWDIAKPLACPRQSLMSVFHSTAICKERPQLDMAHELLQGLPQHAAPSMRILPCMLTASRDMTLHFPNTLINTTPSPTVLRTISIALEEIH